MTVPTALRLFTCAVLLVFLPAHDVQGSINMCGQSTISGLRGNITSPNYPTFYGNYDACYNNIVAPSLSTITITFNALGLEQHATCGYDWIEFTCESNSISRPVRYCGSGYRAPLSLKPCLRASMRFSTDGMITGIGFSVSYDIEPIRCQGNCTPVASGAGYYCFCDANQSPYIAPPYNQCPTGCSDSSTHWACSSPQTPASTTTTTTLPTTTTTLYSACGQSTISSLSGNIITSPNYPSNYGNYQSCYNYIVASSLSTITITFNALGLEQHATCGYDWIEFTCVSNSIRRPIRFCGSGYRAPISFKPCSRVCMRFSSDGMVTGTGFRVSYDIEPIRCQGNCTPVAIGAGYNCSCDANQTPYIAPPYNQCPTGCSDSSTYCACSTTQTIPPSSTTNTTTLPPTTTTTSTTLPTTTTSYSACGQSTITGLRGSITSPNYIYSYGNYQSCYNNIVAPSLSTITITFDTLGLEEHATCGYDWMEFACVSNSISRPVRYCGYGYRSPLSLKPCSRVSMRFSSDGMVTGIGFSVSYDIEPIRCQGNCTPVASGSGYNCSCDANQTPFIAPPYNQCPTGCSDSSTYCACSSPQTIPPASTTTTTTLPPTTRSTTTTLPPTTTTTTTTLPTTTTTSYSVCGQSWITGLRGNITSPNYPYLYENNQHCNYVIVAPSLSTINFTFDALDLEQSSTCYYDWIEFTCESNSTSRPVRYCGYGYRSPLSLKPCSRVSVRFSSDSSVTGTGFSVLYNIEPINCQGNCTPVASGAGYNCTCDDNQTPYIAPPDTQCADGCSDSSTYCACSQPPTDPNNSEFTTAFEWYNPENDTESSNSPPSAMPYPDDTTTS